MGCTASIEAMLMILPPCLALIISRAAAWREEERALEVDIQYSVPQLLGGIQGLGDRVYAGVVDQDVQAPEGLHCGLGHLLGIGQAADVGLDGFRLAALLFDPLYHLAGRVHIDVNDHHRRARLCQTHDDGSPYAHAAAGDDGPLAGQIEDLRDGLLSHV